VFGGYASVPWHEIDGSYIKDEKSFLFSLSPNKRSKHLINNNT
jgi:hypothetical protein